MNLIISLIYAYFFFQDSTSNYRESAISFIKAYARIIRFSIWMSVIVISYNCLVVAPLTAMHIRRQLITYSIIFFSITRNLALHRGLAIMEYVLEAVFCLKPGIVALAYIVVKCS